MFTHRDAGAEERPGLLEAVLLEGPGVRIFIQPQLSYRTNHFTDSPGRIHRVTWRYSDWKRGITACHPTKLRDKMKEDSFIQSQPCLKTEGTFLLGP